MSVFSHMSVQVSLFVGCTTPCGRGFTHTYPYQEAGPIRTHQEMCKLAQTATEKGIPVRDVGRAIV